MGVSLINFLVLATIIERLYEVIKPLWDPEKRDHALELLGVILLGVVINLMAGVDLFVAIGVPLNNLAFLGPWPGVVLTGVFFGGGATYAHELVKLLQGLRQGAESLQPPGK